jgi:hypothetical protein
VQLRKDIKTSEEENADLGTADFDSQCYWNMSQQLDIKKVFASYN